MLRKAVVEKNENGNQQLLEEFHESASVLLTYLQLFVTGEGDDG